MINIRRVGHVGIRVADIQRSLTFYTEVLGCTVTWLRSGADGTVQDAFLRFGDMHHDLVLSQAPPGTGVVSTSQEQRPVHHISFEVGGRDEFLCALTHVRSKGVEITDGPMVQGFEGDGRSLFGSGSRSFFFQDPDGNRLEVYTEMMRVPNGEQFPRKEYADLIERLQRQAGITS